MGNSNNKITHHPVDNVSRQPERYTLRGAQQTTLIKRNSKIDVNQLCTFRVDLEIRQIQTQLTKELHDESDFQKNTKHHKSTLSIERRLKNHSECFPIKKIIKNEIRLAQKDNNHPPLKSLDSYPARPNRTATRILYHILTLEPKVNPVQCPGPRTNSNGELRCFLLFGGLGLSQSWVGVAFNLTSHSESSQRLGWQRVDPGLWGVCGRITARSGPVRQPKSNSNSADKYHSKPGPTRPTLYGPECCAKTSNNVRMLRKIPNNARMSSKIPTNVRFSATHHNHELATHTGRIVQPS